MDRPPGRKSLRLERDRGDQRDYSLPDAPPPIAVSAFGPNAADLAAQIGDGFVTVQPDKDLLTRYRNAGGRGRTVGALKVCWDQDETMARTLAHELWPTEGVEGQISQELPMPSHFEAAAANVTEDMIAEVVPCGPDPERHIKAIVEYVDAGFDKIYINQIGPDQEGFFDFYAQELRPRLGA
jgi:G6PDH family F420-dependent oxidoreductase